MGAVWHRIENVSIHLNITFCVPSQFDPLQSPCVPSTCQPKEPADARSSAYRTLRLHRRCPRRRPRSHCAGCPPPPGGRAGPHGHRYPPCHRAPAGSRPRHRRRTPRE
ncbi:MAG: hypothetical protein C4558_00465 [Dehalococcoidia bacterium]|nr:MAG: hypothetical protein C4558_00465 [Dehalococcoidia bacterium]